jgi:hypothetical protein
MLQVVQWGGRVTKKKGGMMIIIVMMSSEVRVLIQSSYEVLPESF